MSNRHPRRGLHGLVVNGLGERIIRGELAPGHTIDLEQLIEELAVSRTVVREAIKVLTEKGLLAARAGYGTYVTERSQWHLLDEDVMGWRTSGTPDLLLVHELGEIRQIFEPAAARLAAERRTDEQLRDIAVALDGIRSSSESEQADRIIHNDIEFHRAILLAAGNELLQRIEVTLEPALHARNRLTIDPRADKHFLDQHSAVYEAIAGGDPDSAFAAMSTLIADARSDTASAMKQVSGGFRGQRPT